MTPRAPRRSRRAALAVVALCAPLALGAAGCAGLGLDFGGPPSLEISSGRTGGLLVPAFVTAVYTSPDDNTADLYLSDLPLASLTAPDTAPLDNAAGSILHIHYFITPYAGRTPIDFDASNATIRLFVLAPGALAGDPPTLGVYGGGGFLLPTDEPEGDDMSGRIKRATLRFIGGAPGFQDRLATAHLDGAVRATRDDESARAIAATLTAMLDEREVRPATPVAPIEPGEEAGDDAPPAPGSPGAPAEPAAPPGSAAAQSPARSPPSR